jgi:hypothetical protein
LDATPKNPPMPHPSDHDAGCARSEPLDRATGEWDETFISPKPARVSEMLRNVAPAAIRVPVILRRSALVIPRADHRGGWQRS